MNVYKEILVVEDEPVYRSFINRELKSAGYSVILAQNGAEALVALWEKHQIGLVLLDVRLPVISSLNIFEIVRKDFPDKKIIITSVLHNDEQRFFLESADDYYDKSQHLTRLIEKIEKAFNSTTKGALGQNDKRNYKRSPVNVLASCEKRNYDANPACTHFMTYTKDLSPFGGRFIVGDDVKVGQHFTMALELPVNFLPLLIDCEAVWVRKFEDFSASAKRSVEVGVKFVKLDSPRDEEKLKIYLNCV